MRRLHLFDYLLLALAGVGWWASYPYADAWALLVPALAILISRVDRVSVARGAWYGFITGWGFFLAHIWWATVSVGSYLPWLVLAFIQALFIAVWAATTALLGQWHRPLPWPLYTALVALAWVGIEQLRSLVPFGGFPWAHLAYSQVAAPVGRLAPWGSEVTIGAVVVFAAAALRVAARRRQQIRGPRRLVPAVVAIAALTLPGFITLPVAAEDGSLRVGLVQGNVEPPVDDTFATPLKVTNNHVRVTRELLDADAKADLIIWGENSLDRDPEVNPDTNAALHRIVAAARVPLVVGAVSRDEQWRYNEAFVMYPDGQRGQTYVKQRPVPFGEYIPLRGLLSILSKETARVSIDMAPGTKPGVLDVEVPKARQESNSTTGGRSGSRTIRLAVGICFEAAYESIFAEGTRLGGELIVVPTNNSSFGFTPQSLQQLQMVQLRAMSLSRAAMQVSTNGVSAFVSPDGTIVDATQLFTPAWAVAELPLRQELTFSARFGQPLRYAAVGAWVMVVGIGLYRRLVGARVSRRD